MPKVKKTLKGMHEVMDFVQCCRGGDGEWQYKFRVGGRNIKAIPHRGSTLQPSPGDTRFVVRYIRHLHRRNGGHNEVILVELVSRALIDD